MKKFLMRKEIVRIFCLIIMAFAVNITMADAFQNVLTESVAAQKSRISFLMNGTDGKMYNVFIIGENEHFVTGYAWKSTPNDQLYKADSYHAYISEASDSVSNFQYINLFGNNKGYPEYINRSNPTYTGGVFVIKGEQGQPDILASALQRTGGGFVDYRFFAIKNGTLRPMKVLYKDQTTTYVLVGTHQKAYALEDGTIASPYFIQNNGRNNRWGNYTAVYMPDFTNLVLIHAYTNKDE